MRLNNKIYYSLLACLLLVKASKGVKQNYIIQIKRYKI